MRHDWRVILSAALMATVVAPSRAEAGLLQERSETRQPPRSRGRVARTAAKTKKRRPQRNAGSSKKRGASIPFHQVLDELLSELHRDVRVLARDDISPLALASVEVTPNLTEDALVVLENGVTTTLQQIQGLQQVRCAACVSIRSRVEDDSWVVSRGITSRADARRVASDLGVKSFLFVDLEWVETRKQDYLVLNAEITQATSGMIIFSRRYLSTKTRAAYKRRGKKRLTDTPRVQEVLELLQEKPQYTHQLGVANVSLPDDVRAVGFSYRLGEIIGEEKRWTYGFTIQPYFTTNASSTRVGAALNLDIGYTARFANKYIPSLRFGPAVALYLGNTGLRTELEEGSGATEAVNLAPAVGGGVELLSHMNIGLRLRTMAVIPSGGSVESVVVAGVFWLWE